MIKIEGDNLVYKSKKHKSYLFSLSYGNRMKEKVFIRDVLERYDRNKLVGTGIFVNNNPYNFEFYFYLNFEGDTDEFENWINENYSDKERKYNFFIGDFLFSAGKMSYSFVSGIDTDMLDYAINPYGGDGQTFLFSDEATYNKQIKGGINLNKFTVFLSHSSKDKLIVDNVMNKLKESGINAWYDKYEICENDNIYKKIEKGLLESDIGVVFLSKNFINSKSGWTISELNYFVQKQLDCKKNKLVCVNIDLSHYELPPLMQEYKYLNYSEDGILDLIKVLRKRCVKC